QGGIKGLFKTFTVSAYPEIPNATETVESMAPKNPTAFENHSFTFAVSKDDKNLYTSNQDLINGQYVLYNGGIAEDTEYGSTPNLSCTPDFCSQIIVYEPKAVVGNYIVVEPTGTTFTPPEAGSPAPYVEKKQVQNNLVASTTSVYNQTKNPIPSQNSTLNEMRVTPPAPELNQYLLQFLEALLLTLVIETLLLLGLFKLFPSELVSNKSIITASIFASALTLPYVWFVFPYFVAGQFVWGLAFGEIFAFLVEALFYRWFLKISLKKALLFSFIVNLVSFCIGYLISHFWL
ncbi:MAG TPA: hypothetical protein VE973_03880, partial [Candidatus Limnocylindria bacterium]|nr:hypothetical protein [Candidatus Limnocylindria bacterium]